MIGRVSRPSFKRVKTVVAAWTAPCLLFRKICTSIVQMLLAQPFLLPLATLYTSRAMVLVVMLSKVIQSLESLHWRAIATLPLFYLFTVFFLVPGPDPFVREGNVAGNANFL
jgi:predicted permease